MIGDILVLEDDPERLLSFRAALGARMLHAPSARLALLALRTVTFTAIFLDHDLGWSVHYFDCLEPGSGSDVVSYLWHNPDIARDTPIIVHSMNTDKAPGMVAALRESGRRVCRRTYAWEDDSDLQELASRGLWRMGYERTQTWKMPGEHPAAPTRSASA